MVSVIDNKGMHCKTIFVNDNSDMTIDFSIFPKGLYLVRVQTKQGVFVWKVIKD